MSLVETSNPLALGAGSVSSGHYPDNPDKTQGYAHCGDDLVFDKYRHLELQSQLEAKYTAYLTEKQLREELEQECQDLKAKKYRTH
ncbi:hypothetical protein ACFOPX_08345 [Helicobacter baculiformis]|uniref:Uncharacterized protein n=1 Tax=Helicobacter baculiformis TaxID=427351 RepID=A0ABV7ZJS0_9HELI|nr:hypothetical protein [Helicobacter baculiformis]